MATGLNVLGFGLRSGVAHTDKHAAAAVARQTPNASAWLNLAGARSFRSERAARLDKAMTELGVSNGQLAMWIGVNRSTVREWRIGERSIPEARIDAMRSVGQRFRELEHGGQHGMMI